MYRTVMEQLQKWKAKKHRKPLVIRGASQVGKTWLMKAFGAAEYESVVYINFDNNERMRNLFEGSLAVERLVTGLELYAGHKIDPANTLLIFDEVQTGVGRTGSFYAYEQVGVRPDILTSAKGLAAGVPIGAILTYDRYAAHFKPGTHGSTFGGNPLACAVGSYVVDKVSDPLFLEQVCTNSDYLRQELQRLNDKYHVFQEIRGRGFLIGAELAPEYAGKLSTLQKLCTKHQLLVLTAGSNVLRLTPALIITKRIIDEAMVLLERAIQDLVAESKE